MSQVHQSKKSLTDTLATSYHEEGIQEGQGIVTKMQLHSVTLPLQVTCHLPFAKPTQKEKVHKSQKREEQKSKKDPECYLKRTTLVPILPAVCNHRTVSVPCRRNEPPFLATSPISMRLYRHRAACSLGELASL